MTIGVVLFSIYEVQHSKIMAAFSKDDCHDDYIMCAIDKTVKHLGYIVETNKGE